MGAHDSGRWTDVLFFGALLIAASVGVAAWQWPDAPEDEGAVELPDFGLPRVSFELPVELPYRFVRLDRPPAPALELPVDPEAALVEVRTALLETAAVVEESEALAQR